MPADEEDVYRFMFGKKYRAAAASFTGNGSRPVNEDSIGVFQDGSRSCFVLCDGLGGHGMGDVASSTVVQVFEDRFRKASESKKYLADTFLAAQDILLAKQKENRAKDKMKTTACVLSVDEKNAYIAHVGDSRVYVFQDNQVLKRTIDHSVPQMMVLSGQIQESEIRHHPDRNIVLKVMGIEWEDPMYEMEKALPLRKCQAFLLCSDGFWELIYEEEMSQTLAESSDPGDWLSRMVQIVERRGLGTNMDNFSAIAVWVL